MTVEQTYFNKIMAQKKEIATLRKTVRELKDALDLSKSKYDDLVYSATNQNASLNSFNMTLRKTNEILRDDLLSADAELRESQVRIAELEAQLRNVAWYKPVKLQVRESRDRKIRR